MTVPAFLRFVGLRTVLRAAGDGAATMQLLAALGLILLGALSGSSLTPLPVTTALAVLAAGAALPERLARWLCFGALVAVACQVADRGRSVPVRYVAVLGLALVAGAILAGRLRSRARPLPREPGPDFVVAAQRHPWIVTLLVVGVAAADGAIRLGRGDDAEFALVLPLAGLGMAIVLTARAPDLLSRLAPIALGLPVAVGAALTRVRGGARNVDFLWTAASLLLAQIVLWYAVARRTGDDRLRRAVAWAWLAVVPASVVVDAMVPSEAWATPALVMLLPFVVAAAAEVRLRPAVLVPLGAVLLGGAATLGWLLAPAPPEGRKDPTPILRHAELGALWMAAGALVRRARSLTALRSDHPVFTEGPHVPAPAWRAEMLAETAATAAARPS